MKNNCTIEITNWKEVKDHFGFELSKIVSRNLATEFHRTNGATILLPNYDAEGFATFQFVKESANSIFWYEFIGTAK